MKIAQKEEMARRLRAGRQPDGVDATGEREHLRSSRGRRDNDNDNDNDSGSDGGDSGAGDGGGD